MQLDTGWRPGTITRHIHHAVLQRCHLTPESDDMLILLRSSTPCTAMLI